MQLMQSSYATFHTADAKMFLAGLLSRPASPRDYVIVGRVEKHTVAVALAEYDALSEEVRKAAASNAEYHKGLGAIEQEWPSGNSGKLSRVKAMKDSLSMVDSLILMNERLYIPRCLRGKIHETLHISHQVVVRTTRRIGERAW